MEMDSAIDFLISESDAAQEAPDATPEHAKETDEWNVPLHMILKEEMQHALTAEPPLYKYNLSPITFGKTASALRVEPDDPRSLQSLVTHKKKGGGPTVVVVLRRVGCFACREDAMALTQMVQDNPGVHMFGVVKHVKDFRGTHAFHQRYFPFPLYQDTDMNLYDALGHREADNILKIHKGMVRAMSKGISTNMRFFFDTLQGGTLIFDRDGVLRYVYQEQYAEHIGIGDIQAAINAATVMTQATLEL